MDTQTQNPLLSWEAHTHPHHERGKLWFIVAGSIVIAMLIYSVQSQSWSFSTIILMTTAMYWFIHRHTPEERTMALFDWGFHLDGRNVQWKDCTGFWFLEGPGYHELHIEHDKKVIGDFIIQSGAKDVLEIHAILKRFLPELEDRNERKLDTISRICKI